MTTPSIETETPPHRTPFPATVDNLNLPVFRPPPLTSIYSVDVMKEIEALRRHRSLLRQAAGSFTIHRH